jgi:hypothetical protein
MRTVVPNTKKRNVYVVGYHYDDGDTNTFDCELHYVVVSRYRPGSFNPRDGGSPPEPAEYELVAVHCTGSYAGPEGDAHDEMVIENEWLAYGAKQEAMHNDMDQHQYNNSPQENEYD